MVIPTGIPTTETQADIETRPVKLEAEISKCSI